METGSRLRPHPARRIEQLRHYGSFSLAYSTLQAGLKYYETDDGYLAYAMYLGAPFVLADPVAPTPVWPQLVGRFLKEYPHSCFCQVSRPMAALLVRHGYAVNEFGTDFQLQIPTYTFSGTNKFHIRYAERVLPRSGFRIAELPEAVVCWASVRRVSDHWKLGRRNQTRETTFLSRPIVFAEEADTRKFFVFGPEGVVAFVFFDPIYRAGEVVGYLSNAKRYLDTAPEGFDYAVTKFALEVFRREGKTLLHLGAAPFHGVTDCEFPANPVISWLSRFLYPRKWLYNFKGIAEHKVRYRGEAEKIYIATRKQFPVIELIRLARVCNAL
ncbi:DUF2156 domain-containing protein [Gemmata sp. JC673]|uniref:DUF2156 domain-containing protein n=1 Tax=Gemmata algarum TaxID=2975278 RepID=A0ABU5FDA8_9BACT|nr:DUF2156 domain-containing protein [Gemmata algarum]MDY3563774.1 DUF2156 domain-containing protein [Gemmata algarum]